MNEGLSKTIKILEKHFAKYKYAVLVIFCGILLMSLNFGEEEDAEDIKVSEESRQGFDLEEFELDLQNILMQIDGVGRVEVILSLESDSESVYARDVRENSTSDEDSKQASDNFESDVSIISDSDYGESPILIKNIYPIFRGAIIVCDGADNPVVSLEIHEAISAICKLNSDNISILKMKA